MLQYSNKLACMPGPTCCESRRRGRYWCNFDLLNDYDFIIIVSILNELNIHSVAAVRTVNIDVVLNLLCFKYCFNFCVSAMLACSMLHGS